MLVVECRVNLSSIYVLLRGCAVHSDFLHILLISLLSADKKYLEYYEWGFRMITIV